jgi:membrane protein implicated in regulation of membrane protease activity
MTQRTQKIDVQRQAQVAAAGSRWVAPAFVAGLILLLAGPWFTGQHTVGWILIACSVAPFAIFFGILLVVVIVLALIGVADYAQKRRRLKRRAADRGRRQR